MLVLCFQTHNKKELLIKVTNLFLIIPLFCYAIQVKQSLKLKKKMPHAELIRTVHSLELGNYFIDISQLELCKSTSNIFIIASK